MERGESPSSDEQLENSSRGRRRLTETNRCRRNTGIKVAIVDKWRTKRCVGKTLHTKPARDHPVDLSLKSPVIHRMPSSNNNVEFESMLREPLDLSVSSRNRSALNTDFDEIAHNTSSFHAVSSDRLEQSSTTTGSLETIVRTASAKHWLCSCCLAQLENRSELTAHICSNVKQLEHDCVIRFAEFNCQPAHDCHAKIIPAGAQYVVGVGQDQIATLTRYTENQRLGAISAESCSDHGIPATSMDIAPSHSSDSKKVEHPSRGLSTSPDAIACPTSAAGTTECFSDSDVVTDDNDVIGVLAEVEQLTGEQLELSHVCEPTLAAWRPHTIEIDMTSGGCRDVSADQGRTCDISEKTRLARSQRKYHCPYCTRTFPWISYMERHLLTHTGQKPFRCPQCTINFTTRSSRARHLIRTHGLDSHCLAKQQLLLRPYRCHLCMSSFTTQGRLMKHYQERHAGVEINENLPFARRFQIVSKKKRDSTSDETNFAACGVDDDQAGFRRNSSRLSSVPSASLNSKNDDNEYEVDANNNTEQSPKAVTCICPVAQNEFCGPEFEKTSSCVTAAFRPSCSGRQTTETQISTSLITAVTSNKGGLNSQQNNSTGDDVTECWQCSRKLPYHKRHLKDSYLPFRCHLCDASFSARAASLAHTASAHSSDWALLLNSVGADITGYADLIDSVVLEALTAFTEQNTSSTLAVAAISRVRGGVEIRVDISPDSDFTRRKVYCSVCPKRFWTFQDLRRHMRSHTGSGERPYQCDTCNARFTLKTSLTRHKRAQHTDRQSVIKNDSSTESSAEYITTTTATSELPVIVACNESSAFVCRADSQLMESGIA